MITLMQIINRMIIVNLTEQEIESYLLDLMDDQNFTNLEDIIGCELPTHPVVIQRLREVLAQPKLVKSAINVCLMRVGAK